MSELEGPERGVNSPHVTGGETDPGGGHELLKASQLFRNIVCTRVCVCVHTDMRAHMHTHMHLCTCVCAGDGSGGSLTPRPSE